MEEVKNQKEEKNRKKAWIYSVSLHSILFILALLPFLEYPVPPPGQSGVLVAFGEPDRGSGDDKPIVQNEDTAEETPEEVEEIEEPVEEITEPVKEPVEKSEPKSETPTVKEDVVTAEDLEAARIKKQKEEAKKQEEAKERAEREAQEQKQREKEAQERRKAAEAKRKAEEAAKTKGDIDDLFGKGKGDTGKSGSQGDPNGDPNSDVLKGVSTGTGKVGGGLGNRGVKKRPTIKDSSQDRGIVVVKVCVNSSGNVTSADYTQRGSSAISENLRKKSLEAARLFKFTPSDISKQCGTITFDYRLQ